jgi:hypothetical protein
MMQKLMTEPFSTFSLKTSAISLGKIQKIKGNVLEVGANVLR